MDSMDQVIDSYKLFLEIKYPTHCRNYCRRLKVNSEAGKAEAVMFSRLLRNTVDQIRLAEDVRPGGVDFLCILDQSQFVVEVTCLEDECSHSIGVVKQGGRRRDCGMVRNNNTHVADKNIQQDGSTIWL